MRKRPAQEETAILVGVGYRITVKVIEADPEEKPLWEAEAAVVQTAEPSRFAWMV